MMSCAKSKRFLRADFAGDLSLTDRLAWEAHVAECSSCEELVREQARLSEVLGVYREADAAEHVDLDRFVDGVQARIDGASKFAPIARNPWRAKWVPMLAAGLLVALGVWFFAGTTPSTVLPGETDSDQQVAEGTPSGQAPTGRGTDEEGAPETQVTQFGTAREKVMARLQDLMESEPTFETYHESVRDLRSARWPLEPKLARLIGEGSESVARNAVLGLELEGTRMARYELWKLRKNSTVGSLAAAQWLEMGMPAAGARFAREDQRKWVELYWSHGHAEAVAQSARLLDSNQRLDLVKSLLSGARRSEWHAEAAQQVSNLMALSGADGYTLAFEVLVREEIPSELWLGEVAAMPGTSIHMEDWVESASGKAETGVLLALTERLPREQWAFWLADLATQREYAQVGLRVLALQPGRETLRALLDLQDQPRMEGEAWLSAWRSASERSGAPIANLATMINWEYADSLAKALLLSKGPEVDRGMLELLWRGGLEESLAVRMLEAIAHSGNKECLEVLNNLAITWPVPSGEQASACLLALGKLGGEGAAREVLTDFYGMSDGERLERLLDLVTQDSRDSWQESLYLIERRLPRVRQPKREERNATQTTAE